MLLGFFLVFSSRFSCLFVDVLKLLGVIQTLDIARFCRLQTEGPRVSCPQMFWNQVD